jgi:hypothetical protein
VKLTYIEKGDLCQLEVGFKLIKFFFRKEKRRGVLGLSEVGFKLTEICSKNKRDLQ